MFLVNGSISAAMKFFDNFVSAEHSLSIGIEEETSRFYLSILVSNGAVDYEEYYELTYGMLRFFSK